MASKAAHIAGFQKQVPGKLSLHTYTELLHVRVSDIRVNRGDSADRRLSGWRARRNIVQIGVIELRDQQDGRQIHLAESYIALGPVVEHAEAASEHRSAVNRVSHAKARRELAGRAI